MVTDNDDCPNSPIVLMVLILFLLTHLSHLCSALLIKLVRSHSMFFTSLFTPPTKKMATIAVAISIIAC